MNSKRKVTGTPGVTVDYLLQTEGNPWYEKYGESLSELLVTLGVKNKLLRKLQSTHIDANLKTHPSF